MPVVLRPTCTICGFSDPNIKVVEAHDIPVEGIELVVGGVYGFKGEKIPLGYNAAVILGQPVNHDHERQTTAMVYRIQNFRKFEPPEENLLYEIANGERVNLPSDKGSFFNLSDGQYIQVVRLMGVEQGAGFSEPRLIGDDDKEVFSKKAYLDSLVKSLGIDNFRLSRGVLD